MSLPLSAGLNEYDVEGVWLVQRQVLWKIPKYLLDKVQGKPRRDSQKRQAWSLTVDEGEEAGEVSVVKRSGGGEGGSERREKRRERGMG